MYLESWEIFGVTGQLENFHLFFLFIEILLKERREIFDLAYIYLKSMPSLPISVIIYFLLLSPNNLTSDVDSKFHILQMLFFQANTKIGIFDNLL